MNNKNDNNDNDSKFVQRNDRLTWQAATSLNEGFLLVEKNIVQ